jgi:hypothetical protein
MLAPSARSKQANEFAGEIGDHRRVSSVVRACLADKRRRSLHPRFQNWLMLVFN